ncbi:hypothetical protein NGM99_20500 [Mesorhizobium sp. RP14(2022)]|uniref:Uncharacterized protein n=1 Tax=Mesorhizobium liriopis TaxID=2953882 RepID=A0ABT1CBG4_9HYPH|nr:hypothetical protein [Mesorhizobium liriopis]MCO6052172.1 hypothetical protein [Mesorhizobium liriopis]
MGTTLTAQFETRREAEMAVERLVQQYEIERTDVFIAAAGAENTAGEELSGSDTEAGQPSPEDRDDAPLNGTIEVSVDVEDEAKVEKILEAFSEFHASDVEQD